MYRYLYCACEVVKYEKKNKLEVWEINDNDIGKEKKDSETGIDIVKFSVDVGCGKTRKQKMIMRLSRRILNRNIIFQ